MKLPQNQAQAHTLSQVLKDALSGTRVVPPRCAASSLHQALKTPCSTTEHGPRGLWLEGGDINEARPDSGEALTAQTRTGDPGILQQSEALRQGPLGWKVRSYGTEPLEFGGSPSALALFRFPKSKVRWEFLFT